LTRAPECPKRQEGPDHPRLGPLTFPARDFLYRLITSYNDRMNLMSRTLPLENIALDVEATSKKRAFEQAGLLFENHHGIARTAVFQSLIARERLGSTALG